MGRETDQYMNADEYVQELLINVRSLAGEYLNWKKPIFTRERIPRCRSVREGILELSQILRRGKHSFEEMHRKAEQSVRRRTVIPLEYLFHIKKAGKYLKHCVSLALAAELDRNSGELFQEIPENYKKIYPTLELGLCLYTADSRVRIECMRNMLEEKETFDFFFGTEIPGEEAEQDETGSKSFDSSYLLKQPQKNWKDSAGSMTEVIWRNSRW